jgi:hypothetical protein
LVGLGGSLAGAVDGAARHVGHLGAESLEISRDCCGRELERDTGGVGGGDQAVDRLGLDFASCGKGQEDDKEGRSLGKKERLQHHSKGGKKVEGVFSGDSSVKSNDRSEEKKRKNKREKRTTTLVVYIN